MRQSNHLGKTLREDPKDAQTVAHKLMLRAGFIKQIAAGVYAHMPLLLRTLNKISQIIREEMNANGYEELLLPALQPKNLWLDSGRWDDDDEIGGSIFVIRDRRGSSLCLAPAHEEVITEIIRKEVSSYKHLPKKLYQIQTKFYDETRPRLGLIRAREYIMKEAFSFDADEASLDSSYQAMHDAYHMICRRIGLEYRCVEADTGPGADNRCHEFVAFADIEEDTIVYCDSCEYAANQEVGEARLEVYPQDSEEKTREAIFGPGLIGVEPLAEFLNLPVWKTTKTLLFQADDKVVAVMVRGDCDVNELKVKDFLKCNDLTLASPEVIKALTGAEVGYAGPIGLPPEVIVVADHYTRDRINFECGANRTDYHFINVNFGRDFPLPDFGDFKLAKQDHLCPRCDQGKLNEARGIKVANIVKSGTKYSDKLNCAYLNKAGKSQLLFMGDFRINISRLAAAVVEQNHDEAGIIWSPEIAPFQIHLIGLNLETEAVRVEAENLYQRLLDEKIEVLFDDRDVRAGEKFGDADLFGIPLRLTVSKRTCKEQKLELKFRNKNQSEFLTYEDAFKTIKNFCTRQEKTYL
ncbi:MAG: proline--tRNA ligase [Desulfobacterales bacterium]|jgi:prolyl-tRNA synthetase